MHPHIGQRSRKIKCFWNINLIWPYSLLVSVFATVAIFVECTPSYDPGVISGLVDGRVRSPSWSVPHTHTTQLIVVLPAPGLSHFSQAHRAAPTSSNMAEADAPKPEAKTETKRNVMLAIDASKQAENAVKCECYNYQFCRLSLWLHWHWECGSFQIRYDYRYSLKWHRSMIKVSCAANSLGISTKSTPLCSLLSLPSNKTNSISLTPSMAKLPYLAKLFIYSADGAHCLQQFL